jgi:hypothetical protein
MLIYVFLFLISMSTSTEVGTWSKFESMSYTLLSPVKTKDEAEKKCNEIDAKLASIHSDAEIDYLSSQLRTSSAWIG